MRTALATAIGLVLLTAPSPAAAATWTGTWNTNYGRVVLTQAGNIVTGTYLFCSGHLHGTVTGSTVRGRWGQRFPCDGAREGSGRFEFTMTPGGDAFRGHWNYASQRAWYLPWTGVRRGVHVACPPAGASVRYSVTQRGKQAFTTGTGVVRGETHGAMGCTNRLRHVHPGVGGARISLVTTGAAAATLGPRVRRLVLDVVVVATDDADCPLGTTGRVVLTDGRRDHMRTELCNHLHDYRPTATDELDVRVAF